MEHETLYTFSAAQDMPNAGSARSTNVISWTENLGFEVGHRPVFLIVTCNTLPSAGTSLVVALYRHTTTTVSSGKLLLTGEVVARGDMSANPFATGAKHILAAFAMPPRCDRDPDETDQSEYFAPYYTASGDMSSGKVDAYLCYECPKIHTTQVNSSNI